jgi:hypothetical protein
MDLGCGEVEGVALGVDVRGRDTDPEALLEHGPGYDRHGA